MVDVARAHGGGDVGIGHRGDRQQRQAALAHHGAQRRTQRVADRHPRHGLGYRLDTVIEQLGDLGADRARRILRLLERATGHRAHTVDGEHATGYAIGEALHALADAGGGKEIGDHHIRTRGEPIDHATIIRAPRTQHELVVQAVRLGVPRRVARALQDERVMPVGGVGIAGVKSLVNDERAVHAVRRTDCRPQRPVLLEPMRGLHPVQHEVAVGVVRLSVDVDRARDQLVADVVGIERMQGGGGANCGRVHRESGTRGRP